MSDGPLVYLVDDDPSVLKALARVFSVARLRCKTFSSAREFLEHPDFESRCCLVLDVNLPDQSGLDLQRELINGGRAIPIIFISGQGNVPTAVKAMQAGAVHFLQKPFRNDELLAAVREGLDRASRALKTLDDDRRVKERVASLTPREREIFVLVAQGMANKNIATRLDISLQSVKLYRGRVMKKLELSSLADLVRLAEKVVPN
jgi:FixJ family two-component response regulator